MLNNRINEVFHFKGKDILNVYFTAGFPNLNDTAKIITSLDLAGADLIEIGIPFSDPIADGPTIQQSNQKALDNGMTLKLLFEQLEGIRKVTKVPLILMGYLNPIEQYGIKAFCEKCREVGIDGLILPDLPLQVYLHDYKNMFEEAGLLNIFLITPQTSPERIRLIDEASEGFIYMVSSASTTGAKTGISEDQEAYFKRIQDMQLTNPTLIGFGISDQKSFETACQYANGAIIGSAFIKAIENSTSLEKDIQSFVHSIRPKELV